jgi:hypothetical protein
MRLLTLGNLLVLLAACPIAVVILSWPLAGQDARITQDDNAELTKADKDYKFAEQEWAAAAKISLEELLKKDPKTALQQVDDLKSKREKADESSIALRRAMQKVADQTNKALSTTSRSASNAPLASAADSMNGFFQANIDRLNAEIEKEQKSPRPNRQLLDLLELQRDKALNSQTEAEELSKKITTKDISGQRNSTFDALKKVSQDASATLAVQTDIETKDRKLWQGFYDDWKNQIALGVEANRRTRPEVAFIGSWSYDKTSVCRDSNGQLHDLQLKIDEEADGNKSIRGTLTISPGGSVGPNPVTLEFPVGGVGNTLNTYNQLRIPGTTQNLTPSRVTGSIVGPLLRFGLETNLYGFPLGRSGCLDVVFARGQ